MKNILNFSNFTAGELQDILTLALDMKKDPGKYADVLARQMDAVYTDTWVDMEFFNDPAYADRKAETLRKMMPCQVNDAMLQGSRAIVLHDMPMHVGYEISRSVADRHLEHILDQAENRRHAEKALMLTLLQA